jgi:hypothetical protein
MGFPETRCLWSSRLRQFTGAGNAPRRRSGYARFLKPHVRAFVQYRLPFQLRYCVCQFELPLRFNRCPVLRKPFTIEQLAAAIDRIIPLRECDVPQPQLHNGHVRWLAQDRCVGAHSYDVRISICPVISYSKEMADTNQYPSSIRLPSVHRMLEKRLEPRLCHKSRSRAPNAARLVGCHREAASLRSPEHSPTDAQGSTPHPTADH